MIIPRVEGEIDLHGDTQELEERVESVVPDRDFSDVSDNDTKNIGIEDLIDSIKEELDPRIRMHRCRECSFKSSSKPVVSDHIASEHQNTKCAIISQEMLLYMNNVKLKDEQRRSALQNKNDEIYGTICYMRELERFNFFQYVSDDMSDAISDIDIVSPALENPLSSRDELSAVDEFVNPSPSVSPRRRASRCV